MNLLAKYVSLRKILNKIMTPQAIFFDIDGTLVSFKTKSIPESNKTAIKLLKDKDVKVFISTGRAFYDIDNLEDLIFDGYITSNGSYCYDSKGNIIVQNLVSKESLNKLALYLEEKPLPCAFETKKGNFINYVDDTILSMYKLVNIPVPIIRPVSEIIEYDVLQLCAFIDLQREIELLSILTDCNGSRWHPSFMDINAKNCCKATGIDVFMTHFGFKLENTMAFGDGGNDISMLKHAAIGVAMSNATDEVKAVADYVTTSVDDDGIIKALKHFNVL